MVIQETQLVRPMPPDILFGETEIFVPAPELDLWMRRVLIEQSSPLYNPEHEHLNSAELGILWTNAELKIRGQKKAAVAMLPKAFGSKLDKSLRNFLWRMFFRVEPHFVIIFDALEAAGASDRGFCCLSDHELTHCGQKMKYDCPDFNKDGSPKFEMRPHDRELFDSELRRWGARSVFGDQTEMLIKSATEPEMPDIDIAAMCGTCAMR